MDNDINYWLHSACRKSVRADTWLFMPTARFVLADDPGAGKTIMAGLYIRELIMRADSRRILIVAPGSLVEQWREELFESSV